MPCLVRKNSNSTCFDMFWGAENYKDPHSEPTIKYATIQTAVVYNYNILTTPAP